MVQAQLEILREKAEVTIRPLIRNQKNKRFPTKRTLKLFAFLFT